MKSINYVKIPIFNLNPTIQQKINEIIEIKKVEEIKRLEEIGVHNYNWSNKGVKITKQELIIGMKENNINYRVIIYFVDRVDNDLMSSVIVPINLSEIKILIN